MPSIITRGAMSASSFGFRRKSLTIYTFAAGTSTWTAPAGVTSITLTGKGQDGNNGSWNPLYYIEINYMNYPTNYGYTLDNDARTVADSYNSAQTTYNNILSSVTGTSTATANYVSGLLVSKEYFPNLANSGHVYKSSDSISSGYFYKSSPSINYASLSSGNSSTLLNVATVTLGGAYNSSSYTATCGGIYQFSAGSGGSSTTAFGYTFSGGAGQSIPSGSAGIATTTTYNNVTVSPGSTYTIVNNGSVVITY